MTLVLVWAILGYNGALHSSMVGPADDDESSSIAVYVTAFMYALTRAQYYATYP